MADCCFNSEHLSCLQNFFNKNTKHTDTRIQYGGSVLTELAYRESPCWLDRLMSSAVKLREDEAEEKRKRSLLRGSLALLISLLLNSAQFKGTLLAWQPKINNTAGGVTLQSLSYCVALCLSLSKFPQHHCCLPLCLPFPLPLMCHAFAISSPFAHLLLSPTNPPTPPLVHNDRNCTLCLEALGQSSTAVYQTHGTNTPCV